MLAEHFLQIFPCAPLLDLVPIQERVEELDRGSGALWIRRDHRNWCRCCRRDRFQSGSSFLYPHPVGATSLGIAGILPWAAALLARRGRSMRGHAIHGVGHQRPFLFHVVTKTIPASVMIVNRSGKLVAPVSCLSREIL